MPWRACTLELGLARLHNVAMTWGQMRSRVQRCVTTALLYSAGLFISAALAGCQDELLPELPALGARDSGVTVSGISAGAYMAGQFQFAHARQVSGAAIIAGGPYGCARSALAGTLPEPGAAILNFTKAVNGCMLNGLRHWGEPNVTRLADEALARAKAGDIGDLAHVRGDKVYLFTGKSDHVVASEIVEAGARLYKELGLADEHIRLVQHAHAGHGFIAEKAPKACGETASPYLNDCDYDQAGDIFAQLLANGAGRLNQPIGDAEQAGHLISFRQERFLTGLTLHGLAEKGFVYIPNDCRTASGCRIHIAFHGCKQNVESVGDTFARGTGLNNWAASNRVIVLYPQVATSTLNSKACWDWWGYTGREYLTKRAPQTQAVYRMVQQLASKPPEQRRAAGW